MSAEEILEALSNLSPADLELICKRADELLLKAVFDAANAAFEKEGGISLTETQRVVDSWDTK